MSVKMPRLFLPTCKLSDINIYIKRHYGVYLLLLLFFFLSLFFSSFFSVLVLAFAVTFFLYVRRCLCAAGAVLFGSAAIVCTRSSSYRSKGIIKTRCAHTEHRADGYIYML